MAAHIVAMLKDQPEVKEAFDEVLAFADSFKARLEFLERQQKKLTEDAVEGKKASWAKVEAVCRARGLLPADYDPKKYHLHLHEEFNMIVACDCKGAKDGFAELLSKLFGQ